MGCGSSTNNTTRSIRPKRIDQNESSNRRHRKDSDSRRRSRDSADDDRRHENKPIIKKVYLVDKACSPMSSKSKKSQKMFKDFNGGVTIENADFSCQADLQSKKLRSLKSIGSQQKLPKIPSEKKVDKSTERFSKVQKSKSLQRSVKLIPRGINSAQANKPTIFKKVVVIQKRSTAQRSSTPAQETQQAKLVDETMESELGISMSMAKVRVPLLFEEPLNKPGKLLEGIKEEENAEEMEQSYASPVNKRPQSPIKMVKKLPDLSPSKIERPGKMQDPDIQKNKKIGQSPREYPHPVKNKKELILKLDNLERINQLRKNVTEDCLSPIHKDDHVIVKKPSFQEVNQKGPAEPREITKMVIPVIKRSIQQHDSERSVKSDFKTINSNEMNQKLRMMSRKGTNYSTSQMSRYTQRRPEQRYTNDNRLNPMPNQSSAFKQGADQIKRRRSFQLETIKGLLEFFSPNKAPAKRIETMGPPGWGGNKGINMDIFLKSKNDLGHQSTRNYSSKAAGQGMSVGKTSHGRVIYKKKSNAQQRDDSPADRVREDQKNDWGFEK